MAWKIFLAFVFFALAGMPAQAQSKKKLIQYGDQAFSEGNYYEASHFYKEAMQRDSSKLQLLYKYASSLRLLNEYELAEYYYSEILQEDKKNNFPETLFWLAMMQKNNGKYKEAKKNFKKINNKNKRFKDSYFYQKSLQELAACDFALLQTMSPIEGLLIENAGGGINTIHADFGAFRLGDYLYFSSLRLGDSAAIELAEGEKAKWIKLFRHNINQEENNETEELPEEINQDGFHNANGSFSPDGKTFYFTRCGENNQCAIWSAAFDGINFTGFAKLPETINQQEYTSTQPSSAVIDGRQYLFFVSNRPNGQGGLDIWYSEYENGDFQKAVNAGKMVNTIEDEVSPYYHSPSASLYFSSNWHIGFGGFDIFKSTGGPGNFAKPENVGTPLNTGANDFYFTLDSAGVSGYLTSNRKGATVLDGETCCNDIYRFKFPEKEIFDSIPMAVKLVGLISKWLPVTLYFHNDEPNPRSTDTISRQNYLSTYNAYLAMIDTYKKEYSAGLKGQEAEEAREQIEDFFEEQVVKGYNDLQYATKVLLQVLEEGNHIELTLKGYASPLAKSEYNLNLTKRRISSLKNYLREYEGGVFIPYMAAKAENGGLLTFVEMPFGSYKAAVDVSSNLNDLKNSVYSRAAANERKIEIIGIALIDSLKPVTEQPKIDKPVQPKEAPKKLVEEKFPEPGIEKPFFDFGSVDYGQTVEHKFKIRNNGDVDLLIYEAIGSCGCTVPEFSKEPVKPGTEAEITVRFNTLGKLGKQNNTIVLKTNAFPPTLILGISADVVLKK
jgi:tetratricopeptide (TPR) repeat protein